MKRSIFVLITLLAACSASRSQPALQEGTWSGGLTPMNHPDMVIPLTYEVSQVDGHLSVVLINEETRTPTRDVVLDGDTLSFSFNEPEENVKLTCALAHQADDGYAGRCTDAEGKWGRFTMIPPGAAQP